MAISRIFYPIYSSEWFWNERRFEWDTHGVLVEYEIYKTVLGSEDILEMRIANYNTECKNMCLRDWESVVNRTVL
jgi:isoleucyl-tRNA synthetase